MSADDGLRRVLTHWLPKEDGWFWTPIETGTTFGGVPDAHWAHRPSGRDGWVECKSSGGWAVKFEPLQIPWLHTRQACGVRCVVAVRARGAGSAEGAGDSLWIAAGRAAETLDSGGLRALEPVDLLGRWYGPPRSWDWRAIGRILLES